jgi:hypothetical protein
MVHAALMRHTLDNNALTNIGVLAARTRYRTRTREREESGIKKTVSLDPEDPALERITSQHIALTRRSIRLTRCPVSCAASSIRRTGDQNPAPGQLRV